MGWRFGVSVARSEGMVKLGRRPCVSCVRFHTFSSFVTRSATSPSFFVFFFKKNCCIRMTCVSTWQKPSLLPPSRTLQQTHPPIFTRVNTSTHPDIHTHKLRKFACQILIVVCFPYMYVMSSALICMLCRAQEHVERSYMYVLSSSRALLYVCYVERSLARVLCRALFSSCLFAQQ